jgi:hypothetical protein
MYVKAALDQFMGLLCTYVPVSRLLVTCGLWLNSLGKLTSMTDTIAIGLGAQELSEDVLYRALRKKRHRSPHALCMRYHHEVSLSLWICIRY